LHFTLANDAGGRPESRRGAGADRIGRLEGRAPSRLWDDVLELPPSASPKYTCLAVFGIDPLPAAISGGPEPAPAGRP